MASSSSSTVKGVSWVAVTCFDKRSEVLAALAVDIPTPLSCCWVINLDIEDVHVMEESATVVGSVGILVLVPVGDD